MCSAGRAREANQGVCSIAIIAALGCIRLHVCQLLRMHSIHKAGFLFRIGCLGLLHSFLLFLVIAHCRWGRARRGV